VKLIFKNIKFKNFLSYGNYWNEINIENNINFIISGNKDRSNAMGKSSLLKTISFALFGKIQDIVKPDIVNFQNMKDCEVYLTFQKKGDEITVKRGLKPGYFETIINGVTQPQDSDLRIAQRKFEEEILELNYDIFNNLIYCNPNNTISILNTSAAKKRLFIENLFSDMIYFSNLMESTKNKLRSIYKKIEKNNNKIEFYNLNINDLQTDIDNIEVPIFTDDLDEYETLENEYDKLYNENRNIKKIVSELRIKLKDKKEELIKNETDLKDIKNELKNIQWKLKLIDNELLNIENIPKWKDELKTINEFFDKYNDIHNKQKKLEDTTEKLEKSLKIHDKKCLEFTIKLENYEKDKETLYPDNNLKKAVKCPTCGTDVDFNKTKEHFKTERKKIIKKIKDIKGNIKIAEDKKEIVIKKIKESKKLINELQTEIYKYDNYVERKKYLEDMLNEQKEKQKLSLEKDELIKSQKKYEKQQDEVDSLIGSLLLERDEIDFDYRIKNDIFLKMEIMESELKIKKINCDNIKDKQQNALERIKTKKIKIENFLIDREKLINSNEKLNDLCDYLEILKESLKDENIKSHVINIIIPYLNQKVNEYLSNMGFDFYVEFDNWLNISISGPGNRFDCRLGNMSGGESKAIDLITKFALMDLAKLKAKVYPDILILDEILDSSLDEFGVEKLMEIIKVKQETDDIKIFIISHRKELNELTYGKTYRINKKNKFSFIQEN